MTRPEALRYAKEQLGPYLSSKGIDTRRPFLCLNPEHNDRTPSMSFDQRRGKAHCFSCGADYDFVDVVGAELGLQDGKEKLEATYRMLGIQIDTGRATAAQDFAVQLTEQRSGANGAYLRAAHGRIQDTDYPRLRGLSGATVERFGLGFDPRFCTAKGNENWQALIIPTGAGSFTARNTDQHADKKFRIRKQGQSAIFCADELGMKGKPVFVVEGELDALSLFEVGSRAVALGSVANCNQFLTMVAERRPLVPLVLALDEDAEGRRAQEELAKYLTQRGIPFIEASLYGNYKDANEALMANREAFAAAVVEAEDTAEGLAESIDEATDIVWPPLAQRVTPTPFPVHALPPIGSEIVESVAESVQVAPDMCACFLLGAISSAVLGKAVVQVKPDWLEPIQLFIVVGAPPSERKSPAMAPFFEPIERYIRQVNDARRVEIAQSSQRKKALETQLKKATDKGDEPEINRLVEEIENFEEIRPLEALISDATPESLARAMSRNGGAISFKSAEGGLFNTLAGAYSDLPNLDCILQGYTGESIAVERITRESVRIARAALSITLAVQPEPLEKFTANETMLGRGLCARFLYCVPPSRIGDRIFDTRPIPFSTLEVYRARLCALMALPLGEQPALLSLDGAARDALRLWHEEVEGKIASRAEWNGILNGWEGKLVGSTVRVAALLKMLEEPSTAEPIAARHVVAAVEVMRYFILQAIALGGSESGLSGNARQVLSAIEKRGEAVFSPAALRRRLRNRKTFERGEVADAALLELEAAGFLRQGTPPGVGDKGGRPADPVWLVHPDVLRKALRRDLEVIEI